MTNRELVLRTIAESKEGATVSEIVERTGLPRWGVVACIYLEARRMRPLRSDPGDPRSDLRWSLLEI